MVWWVVCPQPLCHGRRRQCARQVRFYLHRRRFFSIPHRNRRWRVGPMTRMMRAGLSCSVKDGSVVIPSAVRTVPLFFSRSKMAGYAAKESALCWLLHISVKLETALGGTIPCGTSRGRSGGAAVRLFLPSLVCLGGGVWGRGPGGRTYGGGAWPVLT